MIRKLQPDKRTKFLDAALTLFATNGVQHTSTAAIAKEAGTAAGTLFLYFPTKQDLIHELVLAVGKEQSDNIQTLLDPSLSVRETFFAIWSGSIDWFLENIDAYIFVQQVRHSRIIDEAVVRESEKYFSYYYETIQRGLEQGCIKPYPSEVIGGILYQDIVAVLDLIFAQPDPSKGEETIQLGFEIFWNGIKT